MCLFGLCLKENVIVIDIGSIKGIIMEVFMVFRESGIMFIGGYLMVGLYKSGVCVVKELLFENVYYLLILMKDVVEDKVVEFRMWLFGMNVKFLVLLLNEYDEIIGMLSYLLYIVVVVLVN